MSASGRGSKRAGPRVCVAGSPSCVRGRPAPHPFGPLPDESTAVIGTPDDLVARIRDMMEITGGFGYVIGFVHDWANREDTLRSWDMVARYVLPEVNGLLDDYRESNKWVIDNRGTWERAGDAIVSKIRENERAAAAMEEDEALGRRVPGGRRLTPGVANTQPEG